jgi:hypothetical protein
MGAYPAYKKDYDAMVFIDGTDVVAISSDGSVIDHGTAGTDDATVIQAAINNLSDGCVLFLVGEFTIQSTINVTKSVSIVGKNSTINWSFSDYAIFASGSTGNTYVLLSDVLTGEYNTIEISSSSDIEVGDLIVIYDDVEWGGYAGFKTGEMHEVKSVDVGVNTTVTTFEGVLHDYSVIQNGSILVIKPIVVNISDIKFVGEYSVSNNSCILLYRCKNSNVSGCTITPVGKDGIITWWCYNLVVEHNYLGNQDRPAGTNTYGIWVSNSSAHVIFRHNYVVDFWHCLTINGNSAQPGQARDIVFFSNFISGSILNSPINSHPIAESLVVDSNIIHTKTPNAIGVSARNIIIRDNTIYGGFIAYSCPCLYGKGTCNITNNQLNNSQYLVIVEQSVGGILENVNIRGNVGNDIGAGIKINSNLTGTVNNVNISDNIFEGVTYTSGISHSILLYDVSGGIISNNIIKSSYRCAISLNDCEYIDIIGNYIKGSNTANFWALQSISIYNGSYINIINNLFKEGVSKADFEYITETVDSHDNCIYNNIFSGDVTSSQMYYRLTVNSDTMVKDNTGYVHVTEIRYIIDTILEKFGTPRLLCPCVETTGTSITDYTRLSNTLTAKTSVVNWCWYQGRATYYDFDGAAHYLYRANDTDFDFGDAATDDAFSVVCCVNPDDVTSRQIIGKWDDNNQREWRLFFDASGYPTFQLYDESADTYIGRQDQTAFTTGSWQVLVATYDGSGINAGCKIYIDGVQLDDADYDNGVYVAMEAVTANLMVGALKNAAVYSEYYDGKMTWIGVAAKELSPDEVWSLTQRLKGVLGI